jgi:hypothetical protein
MSDELVFGLLFVTVTAKGSPALWLVIPVSLVFIAIAVRILGARWRRL